MDSESVLELWGGNSCNLSGNQCGATLTSAPGVYCPTCLCFYLWFIQMSVNLQCCFGVYGKINASCYVLRHDSIFLISIFMSLFFKSLAMLILIFFIKDVDYHWETIREVINFTTVSIIWYKKRGFYHSCKNLWTMKKKSSHNLHGICTPLNWKFRWLNLDCMIRYYKRITFGDVFI